MTATRSEVELKVKDLGVQVPWRLTYIVEYAVPLVAAAISLAILFTYPGPSMLQAAIFAVLFAFHFARRQIESIFVHTFSRPTMPLKSLLRNLFHYVVLGCGTLAAVSYAGVSPLAVSQEPLGLTIVVALLWLCTEIGNCFCHVYLRVLREASRRADWTGFQFVDDPKRTLKVRVGPFTVNLVYPAESDVAWATKHLAHPGWVLPMVWPFTRAIAPNYGFEILGWLLMTVLAPRMALPLPEPWAAILSFVPILLCFVFAVVGASQMSKWAQKKSAYFHLHYPGFTQNRGLMFPF